MPEAIAHRIVWNRVGGPINEVSALLEVAVSIGLIEVTPDGFGRSPSGTRVRQSLRAGDLGAIGLYVLRSGAMADQARRLVESAVLDSTTDCFRCPRELRREAAQLIAILRLVDEIAPIGELVLRRETYERIGAVWVFMQTTEHLPPWLQERQAVGRLAELYSWNLERLSSGDPSKVGWVSLDNDGLGYDIENRNAFPARCIEVKGSRGRDVQFTMSTNEMNKAELLGRQYEIHFWGRLSLKADREQQYRNLLALGYPVTIKDPVAEFELGGWSVEADGWRVVQSSD